MLALGYEKVVINTSLIKRPELITDSARLFGSQSIVASIDSALVNGKYKCMIEDGRQIVDCSPFDLARKAEQLGAGEIIINSIDRDGMMQGYDLELIKGVVGSVKIPVTAIGGAGGIEDLKAALHNGHAHAAAAGSMFVYYGRLKAVLITAPSEEKLIRIGIYQQY